MKLLTELVIASICLLVIIETTHVNKCQRSNLPRIHSNNITISNCTKPPCKLRRNHKYTIEIDILPSKPIKNLTTLVTAKIGPLGPFSFHGVDHTSARTYVFTPNDEKAEWPLEPGRQYVYKRSFKVLGYYPRIGLMVRWSLARSNKKEILCFELPAHIDS